MILQERIDLLAQLGKYILNNTEEWVDVKERASRQNPWFVPEFIELSSNNIATQFLQEDKLLQWVSAYNLPTENTNIKNVGVVMAGNIPLVGFHDFLCVFITGHQITIKASSKDDVLIKHLIKQLYQWEITVQNLVSFSENLKGCDVYIATGSNNSSRYFEYYFGKYPSIIRRNRTSVAILNGEENEQELQLLSDDIQQYFGLGCRNITKLYVPKEYDFIPLLEALKKYDYYFDFHKYKHNYDYNLAILIMGNKLYMNNGSILFVEDKSLFSPISQINYEYYDDIGELENTLKKNTDVQCIVGGNNIALGDAQKPNLSDYADGVDTIQFMKEL